MVDHFSDHEHTRSAGWPHLPACAPVVGPLHGRHSGRRYNAIPLPRPEAAGHRLPGQAHD